MTVNFNSEFWLTRCKVQTSGKGTRGEAGPEVPPSLAWRRVSRSVLRRLPQRDEHMDDTMPRRLRRGKVSRHFRGTWLDFSGKKPEVPIATAKLRRQDYRERTMKDHGVACVNAILIIILLIQVVLTKIWTS